VKAVVVAKVAATEVIEGIAKIAVHAEENAAAKEEIIKDK
jgi:hypothetical protein